MKKTICMLLILSLFLSVAIALAVAACVQPDKYDEEWIIGKTSLEVEEKYGDFYQKQGDRSPDGLFRSATLHYLLKEEPMFFGDVEITLLSIEFDESGIAYECYTQLGPIGG